MSKHTPGPWQLHALKSSWGAYCPSGRPVAKAERLADAEFIVRACNAHEDMLEALKAFVEQATKVSGFPQSYIPYSGALVAARAAIAKAEGTP